MCSQDHRMEQELVSKTRHLCMDITQDSPLSAALCSQSAHQSELGNCPQADRGADTVQSLSILPTEDVSMMTFDVELSNVTTTSSDDVQSRSVKILGCFSNSVSFIQSICVLLLITAY